jgi:hypothetical protein
VFANPFTSTQLGRYAALVGGMTKPPRFLMKLYRAAGHHYKLPWQVLAAINYVETGYGRDLRVSSAGAVGWMQFMPQTWVEYGRRVTRKDKVTVHVGNPWQPRDAIFAAAHYLVSNGAHRNLPRAIYAYNHAGWYVDEVLAIAAELDSRGLKPSESAHRKLAAMRTMARLLNGMPYVWGGGHATWQLSNGYDCSGFVSAVLHSAGYLSYPVTTQTLPGQHGIRTGPGRWVTIFDRTNDSIEGDHVIMDIAGQWWESGGGGAAGAPRVHRMRRVNATYLESFNRILHPRGL